MSTGHKKLGKYDVLDVIGRGGMGVIYKGIDPGIGRIVAIKMMTGGFAENPELLQRFYREAQSAGKLQHPNIVTIYDLGVQDGNPYLVMEFLEGESLEAAIKSRRSILLEDKLNIVIQICDGLGYAHQRHIVHRDIKPANIMLLKDGGVKIVDFGIARIGNESMTRPGQIMGSIQYMSPEQINAGSVDARSDIFSLGVLLYQFLTSTLPFEGKDTGETLLKIIHQQPRPLAEFLREYPADLDDIVRRVLAKDREQRYQATEDLAFDLAHVQEQLKRERIAEYVDSAQAARGQGQLTRAKEQLLQVLKIDRQNSRAADLLREVQQEIQKQQRGEQAHELQGEAEKALARGDLATALAYLEQAIALDNGNVEIAQLCASVRENKARADALRELLQQAEMAQDAGDLEEARRAVDEALRIDENSTEVRSLHAAICREIAERDRQLQVQKFLGEARKQISSRQFTAALQVLKQAESIDAAVPGIQELINLAETGQQQEKRRKDLERLTSDIEEALNRDDYVTACAKAEEGLRRYPADRGLSKLKAVADRQRAASEKRNYIENKISAARKLLDGHKNDEALQCLEEALQKYPGEFALQSMHALVTESIERERAEQKKADVTQKANEAIRRKDYSQAISILEAARQETGSSDFDDLLQFAQDEAASYAKRQAIDAVAERAQRLSSEEKYQEAIALLEGTLLEYPDQELEIILSDIRRHVEEFNSMVQEAVGIADRLLRQERYTEAVKFLEGKGANYAKSPEFRAILEEARQQQQLNQVLSLAKEEVRDAISRSELDQAQEVWQRYCQQLGELRELRLLGEEIAAKRMELAKAVLEMSLRDARMLLTVGSFESAVSVLETAAVQAPHAEAELRTQFDNLLQMARAGFNAQLQKRGQQKAQPVPAGPTEAESFLTRPAISGARPPETLNPADETQVADTQHLQKILGEVTQIADHYQDGRVQSAIDTLKQQITSRIFELREAEATPENVEQLVRDQGQSPPEAAEEEAETIPSWETLKVQPASPTRPTTQVQPTMVEELAPEAPLPAVLAPSAGVQVPEALTSVAQEQTPVVQEKLEVLSTNEPAAAVYMPEPAAMVAPPILTPLEAQPQQEAAPPLVADASALEEQLLQRLEEEEKATEAEEPPVITPATPSVADASALDEQLLQRLEEEEKATEAEEPPVTTPAPPLVEDASGLEAALLKRLEEEERGAAAEVPPVIAPAPPPAPPVVTQPRLPPPPPSRRPVSRPLAPPVSIWKKPSALIAGSVALAVLIGLALYGGRGYLHPVTQVQAPLAQKPSQPQVNPIQVRQQDALNQAEKLQIADDLQGAREKLQEVAGLNGPLSPEIQSRLAEINRLMNDQNLRQLRRTEELLFQRAVEETNKGQFAAARRDFQRILLLGEGAQRKTQAQQYLSQTIPAREKEERLFAAAQQASASGTADGLQKAAQLLDQVIALNGPRKPAAQSLRETVSSRMEELAKQEQGRQIAALQAGISKDERAGNFSAAREKVAKLKQLGVDTTAAAAQVDQMEKTAQADAVADQAFNQAVQLYRQASASKDKTGLQAALTQFQQIAQSGGKHAAEAANYVTQANKALAALQTPAQPPVSTPPQSPSSNADQQSIRAVLDQFNAAYEHGQLGELKAVWPRAQQKYTDFMRERNGYSFVMALHPTGAIQITGSNAVVPCDLVSTTTTPGGKTQHPTSVKVKLRKAGDRWLIVDPLSSAN